MVKFCFKKKLVVHRGGRHVSINNRGMSETLIIYSKLEL